MEIECTLISGLSCQVECCISEIQTVTDFWEALSLWDNALLVLITEAQQDNELKSSVTTGERKDSSWNISAVS